jgi:hypothetical protein
MATHLDTLFIPLYSSETNPLLGAPVHFFRRLILAHNYRISRLMENTPAAIAKDANALQSITAMKLFYCQHGILGWTLLAQVSDLDTMKEYSRHGAFSRRDESAYFALAETQYRMQLDRAVVTGYLALCHATLHWHTCTYCRESH